MTTPQVDLHDPAAARNFYSARYVSGYMQDWPPDKLARVEAVIHELRLSPTGRFLDLGCGTGVFTEVLMRALPGWTAWGTDIVEIAVQKASIRVPGARFVPLNQLSGVFDFVFSHHVLEHVSDLAETASLLACLCVPEGRMLHIMPCGNAGSLEFDICAAARDGMDPARGGRFFFEDQGHLRRLTSDGLAAALGNVGFEPVHTLFANHYYGALKWMTEHPPGWLKTTLDPARGRDAEAAAFISATRRRVLRLRYMRRPTSLIPGFEWRLSKPERAWWETAALVAANPLTLASGFVDRWLTSAEQREWTKRRGDPRGSEMYSVSRRIG